MFRAIHIGGNWGTNTAGISELPPDYFEWLRDLNVNWVGISVALSVNDSMDSTVERRYSGPGILTFSDENLTRLIHTLRKHGFNVYLTLAFEFDNHAVVATHPVARWQLGDPNAYLASPDVLPRIQREYWPWDPTHPNHQSFVREFFQTYTEQAVHFARIAQAEGVGMYSLGTETDRLFRTRSGDGWTTEFGDELRSMVNSVRDVYTGLLTYDMVYNVLTDNAFYGTGSNHLWEDLDLDVIGISAYFPLTLGEPNQLISVIDFEAMWEGIFREHLGSLREANPGKPIIFLECGYTDSMASPYRPNADEFVARVVVDGNSNGFDDGAEMQANVLKALFNVIDRQPNVIKGAFLWDNMIASDATWNNSFGQLRGFSIRNKLAEDVVRSRYAQWFNQS